MAQPIPYMQFYFADYDADTAHLSTFEHGVYFLLIKAYWKSGRALADNDRRLAILAGLSQAEWQEVRPDILPFFAVADGLWVHKRIEAELAKVRGRAEQARASGAEGARRRWAARPGTQVGDREAAAGPPELPGIGALAGDLNGHPNGDPIAQPNGDPNGDPIGEIMAISDSDSDSDSEIEEESSSGSIASLVAAWDAMANAHGLPAIRTMTEARRRSARARLREHGEADVLRAIALIAERPFLLGGGRRGWKADLDWLLRPASIPRILEGQRYLSCDEEDDRPSGWRA